MTTIVELADGRRGPAELEEEHEDQDEREPEIRERPRQHAVDEHRAVGDARLR